MDAQYLYELFADKAIKFGPEKARDIFANRGACSPEKADELLARYKDNVHRVVVGDPPVIAPADVDPWYPGPEGESPAWKALVDKLEEMGRDAQIPALDSASTKVVQHTPDPAEPARPARGLVVGHVQSGKTSNFTAVAAKLADCDYRAVIVLSGIHNALRKQTQERLNAQLADLNPELWFKITTLDDDFRGTGSPVTHLSSEGKTLLIVAKKNATVLKRLLKWFRQPSARQVLQESKILVIDDEADQASVATSSINPLIRDLLRTMPRSVYIGYTATPFANVFIDPSNSDDLYPRDFILSLPQPEEYFGTEKVFGRPDADPAKEDVDGYDMIRIIPETDEFLLRPQNKDEEDGFIPTITSEVRQAVSWFLMATAARYHRGQYKHSSMLIHTSFKTVVHEAFRAPLDKLVREFRDAVANSEEKVLSALRAQWEDETTKVPATDFGREGETFDEILVHLPEVLERAAVVIDNSRSDARLEYKEEYEPHEAVVAIAVGGNTLSRGLTLEGLVSSLFIRPGNAYDTLMQMGRWFGFRIGYEDLPRIWMTDTLRGYFRDLSQVEYEMRQDIEAYQLQNQTPLDVAVRIRTHPALRVTAKMGAAAPARTSYSGSRLQTRFFYHRDPAWLETNSEAAERLITSAARNIVPETVENNILLRDVPVSLIEGFLDMYRIHPSATEMDTDLLKRYIQSQYSKDEPELTRWNVAVIGGSGAPVSIGGIETAFNIRSQLKEKAGDDPGKEYADIKTLMSKEDLVVDLPSIDQTSAKKAKESELKTKRVTDPVYSRHGLLVLYPIDPDSKPTGVRTRLRAPLDALAMPIGLGLVFPHASDEFTESASVRTTHVAVELPTNPENVDTDDDIYGESR